MNGRKPMPNERTVIMINKEAVDNKEQTMYDVKVLRAKDMSKDGKTIIAVDMEVNGVKIYGCTYREGIKNGKEWNLVDFPSVKGKDGNYYNRAWFPISKELCDLIAKAIGKILK